MTLISRDELETLARRYVWWQAPGETLESPDVLLLQILRLGTADDYMTAREHWGEAAFKRALTTAPAGALDERSWVFWHRQYGLPLKPAAKRSFS
jgi:hypothetical protein